MFRKFLCTTVTIKVRDKVRISVRVTVRLRVRVRICKVSIKCHPSSSSDTSANSVVE